MSSDDHAGSGIDQLVQTVDRLPLAPSFFGGVGAFVGGYVFFVITLAVSGSPNFSAPVRTLQQIGGIFYNAQNVPLLRHREITIGDQTIPQEATLNLIQQADPSLPRFVYYLIPVAALAIVGTVLVHRYVSSVDPVETVGAVVAGTTLGYLLAAMVGTVLVTQRTTMENASETLGPVKLDALVYGMAYPLVITLAIGTVVLLVRHRDALVERVSIDQA